MTLCISFSTSVVSFGNFWVSFLMIWDPLEVIFDVCGTLCDVLGVPFWHLLYHLLFLFAILDPYSTLYGASLHPALRLNNWVWVYEQDFLKKNLSVPIGSGSKPFENNCNPFHFDKCQTCPEGVRKLASAFPLLSMFEKSVVKSKTPLVWVCHLLKRSRPK